MSSSAPPHGSRPRVAGVDGLRACAALTVLAYHVALAHSLTRAGSLAPLFAQLKAGVGVFFVISGFVLYLPYAQAIAIGAPLPAWRPFLNHRALRILPAYWVTLTILSLGPLQATTIGPNGWRYFTLAQIYDPDTLLGGLGVAWSLCVEVSFYAVLPIFAWVVSRCARGPRSQLLVLGGLALGGLLTRLAVAGSTIAPVSPDDPVLVTALPGFVDWFAAGMALAVVAGAWSADRQLLPRVAALARRPAGCWALAAACFLLSVWVQPSDQFLPFYSVAAHLATGVGSALLLLPVLGARSGLVTRLEHPVMTWLGTVSYGIYLWHVPVLHALTGTQPVTATAGDIGHALATFVLVAALAAVIGAISWHLVERPSTRLLSAGRATGRAAAPAAKTV